MARRNGMYWDEVEDKLLETYFSTESTEIQKVKALNKVMPKLRMMSRIILERFYPQAFNMPELIDDAIMHFLLKCNFDSSKGSYYSYIGTTFKHYFHDKIVSEKRFKNLNIDRNYDINENEWVINDHSINIEDFDYDDRHYKLNKIIQFLDDKLSKRTAYVEKISVDSKKYETISEEIKMLELVKEYFNTYFLTTNLTIQGLSDYIRLSIDIPVYKQYRFIKQIFGISSLIEEFDDRESIIENKKKIDDISYLMDDYTPEDFKKQHTKIGYRKNFKKKNGIKVEYRYF